MDSSKGTRRRSRMNATSGLTRPPAARCFDASTADPIVKMIDECTVGHCIEITIDATRSRMNTATGMHQNLEQGPWVGLESGARQEVIDSCADR